MLIRNLWFAFEYAGEGCNSFHYFVSMRQLGIGYEGKRRIFCRQNRFFIKNKPNKTILRRGMIFLPTFARAFFSNKWMISKETKRGRDALIQYDHHVALLGNQLTGEVDGNTIGCDNTRLFRGGEISIPPVPSKKKEARYASYWSSESTPSSRNTLSLKKSMKLWNKLLGGRKVNLTYNVTPIIITLT